MIDAPVEQHSRAAVEHLKEFGWFLFMVNLVAGLLALVLSRSVGGTAAFWAYIVLAAPITLFVGGTAILNVACVALYEKWRGRRS